MRGEGMRKQRTNPNFMNGVPELLVLRLLSEKKMYGYELVREIKERSSNTLFFGEGCIYPILHSLERQGYLKSERLDIDGRSRFYYSLTKRGKERFAALSDEWRHAQSGVSLILGRMNPGHANA